jgi:hypothetical protein
MPVNGARISLDPGNLSYTTDDLNNGFFIFDNLEPGSYILRIKADRYVTVTTPELKVDSSKVTYYAGYLKPREVSGRETSLSGNGVEEIRIYPNPATSTLNIGLKSEPSISEYSIADLSGRNIRTGTIPENSCPIQISVEDLKKGAYILIINRKGSNSHAIFIKL